MRATVRTLCLVAALAASSLVAAPARATTNLCCEMYNAAQCQWYTTSCPASTSGHDWISVAMPDSELFHGGAQVQTQWGGTYSGGLCLAQTSASPGEYVAPSVCIRLVPPPSGPLVQVSIEPWNGNSFAFEVSPATAAYFGGVYMSCYAGSALKDDWGVATHAVGSGYTCGPLRAMTMNTAGAGGGNFHFLPSVNTAGFLGVQPRISAYYGAHLVGHYDLLLVRTGSPNATITWRRTVNGVNKPDVVLGTTDQYGSADVWNPMSGGYWQSSDAGTNTMWITAGTAFSSNTITFTVQ